jgi:N-acetylglucosaminyldiphosphoundecaprenol N-acetyl-beta-D-mannosaminyltransferase
MHLRGNEIREISVGYARIAQINSTDAVRRISELAARPGCDLLVTPNIHHVSTLRKDAEFRRAYDKATLQVADGWPVAMIASIRAGSVVPRVAGSDLISLTFSDAASRGLRVGIVGGPPGAALSAANSLLERFPNLRIAVVEEAPRELEEDLDELRAFRGRLERARPDLVALGLGAPTQELFAVHYMMDLPIGLIMCVGAGIEFEAQFRKRAPRLIQMLRLEWAFRAIHEPKRLGPRYLRSAFGFGLALIRPVHDTGSR